MNMPNVVIHPPEEDHIEPWCCFDAAQPPSPDPYPNPSTHIHFDLETESPGFHSNNPFAHQGTPLSRSPNQRSVVDAYQSHDPYADEDEDDDIEDDLQRQLDDARRDYHQQQRSVPSSSTGDDSEIVEVVKVRRHKQEHVYDDDDGDLPQQPSTFRSRASRAFRSLTGSLRSSSSKHRSAQDVFSTEVPHSRPRSPAIPRRSSGMLSQLFTAPGTSLKSRSSVSSFDGPSPTESDAPFPSSRSSTSMLSRSSSSRRSSIYAEPPPEHARAPSPAPSTATATRRKFSRLNLRKVFSFSSADSTVVPDSSSGRTTPTLVSSTGPQTPTSTDSGDGVDENSTPRPGRQKPTSLDRDSGVGLRLDFGTSEEFQLNDPRKESAKTKMTVADANVGDVSFEMRLDSLHFDELSFDAERFTIPS